MILPQFANYGPPCFEFFVNTTENHRNLVHEGLWFWWDWGFWWLFRRACLLQRWKHWGAGGFMLLALTCEGLTQKNYELR